MQRYEPSLIDEMVIKAALEEGREVYRAAG